MRSSYSKSFQRSPSRPDRSRPMLRMLQAGLGLLLVASACSGGDDAVTTTSTAAATTMSATGATFSDRMETIEAMVTARNSGDFDAWRAFFPAEAPVIWASTVQNESDLDWQRSYMAADEVWTITGDCREQGAFATSCSSSSSPPCRISGSTR